MCIKKLWHLYAFPIFVSFYIFPLWMPSYFHPIPDLTGYCISTTNGYGWRHMFWGVCRPINCWTVKISANCILGYSIQVVKYVNKTLIYHTELIKACQIYFVRCVSKTKHNVSVIHYKIYWAVWFEFTHYLSDDLENIHFVLLSSSDGKYRLLSIV